MRSLAFISCLFLLSGCPFEPNPKYCNVSEDPNERDGCEPGFLCVTNGSSSECVESCLTATCDVDSATPRCDTESELCVACDVNIPCLNGGVCRPDGSCEIVMCTPDDNACGSGAPVCGPDGMCAPCTAGTAGDGDCAVHAPLSYCVANNAGGTQCAACRDDMHCEQGQVCHEGSFTCGPCTEHSQCANQACLDGVCLEETDILYVEPNGDDAPMLCSSAAPCKTINGALAVMNTGDQRSFIMVEGDATVTYEGVLAMPDRRVFLHGQGAVIKPVGTPIDDKPVIVIDQANSVIDIENFDVRGAGGGAGADGIDCDGGAELRVRLAKIQDNDGQGIQALDCTLTVERSTVVRNKLGGIRVRDAAFTIRNNFIVFNGDQFVSNFGGVLIDNGDSQQSPQLFDFNTVARNTSLDIGGVASTGFGCTANTTAVTAVGNIVFDNQGPGMVPATRLANCVFEYSNVQDDDVGANNINVPPAFVNWMTDDFHLDGPQESVDVPGLMPAWCEQGCLDNDGNERPYNGAYDMGADEYVP